MLRLIALLLALFSFLSPQLEGYCSAGADIAMEEILENEIDFYAFVSFSIPETTLKEISNHLERIGGSFVFRGMPNGSFKDFILKVKELRDKGILANALVDPDLFNEYGVTVVPTFLYIPPPKASEAFREDTSSPKYKKIVGNVSVPWALREMGVEL